MERKKVKNTFMRMYAINALTIALISVLTIEFNFLLEKYQTSGIALRGLSTFIFSFGVSLVVFVIIGLIFNNGHLKERLNGEVE